MALSNVQRLTRGGQKYAAKTKAKNTEEVSFDPESRIDFLTGFHKRKLARQAEGRRKAEEINRQQRLEERRKVREERRSKIEKGLLRLQQAEKNIERTASEATDANFTGNTSHMLDSDEEFCGFDEPSGILKRRDVKYGNSNVSFEEINLDPYVDISRSEEVLDEATRKANEYAAYVASLESAEAEAKKKAQKVKSKKFRYLPKSERKLMNRRNNVR